MFFLLLFRSQTSLYLDRLIRERNLLFNLQNTLHDRWGRILDTDYLFLVCYQKGYSNAINQIRGILYRLQSCS